MRTTIGRTAAFALSLTAALALAGCQTPTEDKAPSVPTTSAPSDTTEPNTEESGTAEPTTEDAESGTAEPTTEDVESGSPEATTDSGTEDDSTDTETSAGDQGGQAGATQVEVVSVFGTDGYPTGAWTIEDFSDQQPIVCSYPSPSVVDQHGWVCGASADSGLACLDNPLAADEVICVSDPIAHEGFRRKADMSMIEEGAGARLGPAATAAAGRRLGMEPALRWRRQRHSRRPGPLLLVRAGLRRGSVVGQLRQRRGQPRPGLLDRAPRPDRRQAEPAR